MSADARSAIQSAARRTGRGTGAGARSWICDFREGPAKQVMTILKWAMIFLLVSIVAGIFGFTGISAATADVARFLFYVFVVIFLVLLILGLTIFSV
jgi:uncharacterized membrane protein YtjA (UPF0391 family)